MRAFGLATAAVLILATQAAAADAKFEKSLMMLDPSERLEQLCDYTAMARIRDDDKSFRPDRAVANAMGEPQVKNDKIDTKGGAFRSRGKWYALSYSCQATPDHISVVSFKYTVGAEIPEAKWAAFGLWD